ncbi:hypothetical protein BpHYR1_042600 [Brachionus plicatilis]|uniref:Uncharacterized protein n=1 Tax=Brachionus plicatilis TaxID=10195 RepID=A0A3M7PEM2_BRAPC|nr:hypothetical protein BpHYR1_042600 [Brachionus plicatilis]
MSKQMSQKTEEIIEYFSNLINEIDIICEKAILFFKTEDALTEIQANREKIISKIKQTELSKLKNFNDSETLYDGTFAFFISNDQFKDKSNNPCQFRPNLLSKYNESDHTSDEKLDLNNNAPFSWTMSQKRGEKFEFVKHLGQLVVASSLEQNIVQILINCQLNTKFESNFLEKESTKFQVYAQLIKNKNDHVIIDLSQKERNIIDSLKLTSQSEDEILMTESGFEMIPTYLNVDSVKELKIVGYCDTEFPTQIFRPFKNLARLKIDLFDLQFLNENSFRGLESLEILELAKLLIDIDENAFKALINLRLLIFTKCYFGNFHKKSGLENLKALKIKHSNFVDFRLEYLQLFKNLENIQIFRSEFAKSEIKSFNGLENLKILETDLTEETLFKSNLEILSLDFQSFKPHASFNGLKFLNIRVGCLEQIEHLNQLNQLEFLDFELDEKLVDDFNQVNLPKLKYLVLICSNTPNFNQSLQNLQGLELIGARFMPRDRFLNLKSLDYLALKDSLQSMLETFYRTTFNTIKNLKFLKIENYLYEFSYDDDKKNEIYEKLSKLFESPENVLFNDSMCDNECLLELSAKLGEEQITERVYFEKCLKVSECIRQFVLNKDSNYYKEYLRNTKRRQSNFGLDEEYSKMDFSEMGYESEADFYLSYNEFMSTCHEHDEFEFNNDEYTIDYGDFDYGQL